jgi:hypothetical protein
MNNKEERTIVCQASTKKGGLRNVYCCEAFQGLFSNMKDVWDAVKQIKGVFSTDSFRVITIDISGDKLTTLAFCPICGRPYATKNKKELNKK